jgi:hypothetical protein
MQSTINGLEKDNRATGERFSEHPLAKAIVKRATESMLRVRAKLTSIPKSESNHYALF